MFEFSAIKLYDLVVKVVCVWAQLHTDPETLNQSFKILLDEQWKHHNHRQKSLKSKQGMYRNNNLTLFSATVFQVSAIRINGFPQ